MLAFWLFRCCPAGRQEHSAQAGARELHCCEALAIGATVFFWLRLTPRACGVPGYGCTNE
jgi:hypothetical protein